MTAQSNNIWTPTYFPRLTTAPVFPPLRWWYNWTTPPLPEPVSFRIQEMERQARLISTVALMHIVFLLVMGVIDAINTQYSILLWHGFCILGSILPLWLNRRKHRRTASWALIMLSELAIIVTLVLEQFVFKQSVMAFFGLYFLLLPQIVVALLLSINSMCLVLLANCLYSVFFILFLGVGADLRLELNTRYVILFSTCSLFIFVFLLNWLWRRNVAYIMAHADSIEVVAALEHAMAEQEHSTAQRKRVLDQSVNKLMQAHMHIANGEYDIRVPIGEEDVLWPIAGSLNTLLARIQRLGRDARKLEKTEQEAAKLAAVLRAMRTGGAQIPFQRSGTAVDLIIIELATDVYSVTEEQADHD